MTESERLRPAELTAMRERLGLDATQLAAELDLTPAVIQAWESGRVRVPRRTAELLRWRVGLLDRQEALAASGLPECGWVRRWASEPPPRAAGGRRERERLLQLHASACPTCIARAAFLRERFPPLPAPPLFGINRALVWLLRRPAWLRPAILGAVLVGGMQAVRELPIAAAGDVRGALQALAVVVLSAVAGAYVGAVGGLTFSAVRAPLRRRLGRAGDVLTGVLCALAYLLAIVLPLAALGVAGVWRSPSLWVLFAVFGVIFGLFLAYGMPARERGGGAG